MKIRIVRLLFVLVLVFMPAKLVFAQKKDMPKPGVWFTLLKNTMKVEGDNETKIGEYFFGFVDCDNSWRKYLLVYANTPDGKTALIVEARLFKVVVDQTSIAPQVKVDSEGLPTLRLSQKEAEYFRQLVARLAAHTHAPKRIT